MRTIKFHLENTESEIEVLTPKRAGLPAFVNVKLDDYSADSVFVESPERVLAVTIQALIQHARDRYGIDQIHTVKGG